MTRMNRTVAAPPAPRPSRNTGARQAAPVTLLAFALMTLLAPVAYADSGWVTFDHLMSWILRTNTSFSTTQLREMDLTKDYMRHAQLLPTVDIADVACFLTNCHRQASFNDPAIPPAGEVSLKVGEGAGTVRVPVFFELPVVGTGCTLAYSLAGSSATPGLDFTHGPNLDLTTTTGEVPIPAGSTRVEIPIAIVNDTILDENLESMLLTLKPGACYGLGSPVQLPVLIEDNDNTWQGSVALGPASSPGDAEFLFTMKITNGPSGLPTGEIMSGSMGLFPCLDWNETTQTCGSYPPVTIDAMDATHFQASIPDVTLGADNGFGVEVTCSFGFTAVDDTSIGQIIDGSTIAGRFTEECTAPGHEYLLRGPAGGTMLLEGIFSMTREVSTNAVPARYQEGGE